VEAEDALARGVLDLEAYRRAASGDPTCTRCSEVLARLEAQAQPVVQSAEEAERRQGALAIAATLFALLGAWMWMARGAPAPVAHEDEELEADEGPAHHDVTLPG